jgi:type IV secretion system protein VirB1
LPEALATVRMLEGRGYNFSLGLAQVNRYNLGRYGLSSYAQAFDACPNLQAGARILAECNARAGGDCGKAFSCYDSGDFSTGYRHGNVQKVFASMRAGQDESQPIPVVDRRWPAPTSRKPRPSSLAPAPPRTGSRVASEAAAPLPAQETVAARSDNAFVF